MRHCFSPRSPGEEEKRRKGEEEKRKKMKRGK